MRHIFILLAGLVFVCGSIDAQTVKNAGYQTVAHIKADGTIQDASYRTIGHADGIPLRWAAFYFFSSN